MFGCCRLAVIRISDEESLGAEHGAEFRFEHLDGDLTVVLRSCGEIDGGHAALADDALDAVAVGERRGEMRRYVRGRYAHLLPSASSFAFTGPSQLTQVTSLPVWCPIARAMTKCLPSGVTS